jgi:GT2 family glycosyltransferase
MLVTVATPTHGGITIVTHMCLLTALMQLKVSWHSVFSRGPYIVDNRNDCVRMSLSANATHIMFVDTDIKFPADGIPKLIAHDKWVVGGAYNLKVLPLGTAVRVFKDGEIVVPEALPNKLFEAAVVPTGFLLINNEIFKHIEQPWFTFKIDGERHMGEDNFFCEKVIKAGFKVWCDPTIELKHIGDYEY